MFEKIDNFIKKTYKDKIKKSMIEEGYLVTEKTLEKSMEKIHSRSIENVLEIYQDIALWYDSHYVDGEFLMSGSDLDYFMNLLIPALEENKLLDEIFLDFIDNLFLYADESKEHDLYVETLNHAYDLCQKCEKNDCTV